MNLFKLISNPVSCLFVMLLLVSSTVLAETMYVSDELEITLRNGPGVKYKINKMLRSGEPLDIINQNASGYTQVNTAQGISGWVLTRFLMNEPSARSRMDELIQGEAQIATQRQEIEKLRTTVQIGTQNANTLKITNSDLEANLAKVKQIAANTIQINNQNKELATALLNSEAKQASLQKENERLTSNKEQAWFIRGAGVILLGMILGLLIPKLRFRKKHTWGGYSSYDT